MDKILKDFTFTFTRITKDFHFKRGFIYAALATNMPSDGENNNYNKNVL